VAVTSHSGQINQVVVADLFLNLSRHLFYMANYSTEDLAKMHHYPYVKTVTHLVEFSEEVKKKLHKEIMNMTPGDEDPVDGVVFRDVDMNTIHIYFYEELSEQAENKLDKLVEKWVNPT